MKQVVATRIQRAGAIALPVFLFVSPFSKAAVETLFSLLLILWLVGWKRPFGWGNLSNIPAPTQRLLLLLGLYLAVCGASIFYSSFSDLSLRGFIRKTLEYALLFVIAADLVDQPHTARRSVMALMAASWLVVLYGLLQEWTIYKAVYKPQAVDPIRGFTLDYIRMVGPYDNPNDLATFLMVAALIAIALIPQLRGTRHLIATRVLSALLIGCLVWTRSKGAIFGLLGGAALLGILHRRKSQLLLELGGVAAVSIAFFLFVSRDDLKEILTLSDNASQDRGIMWNAAWTMFLDEPIWGHGLNTFMANYSRYAIDPTHNPAYAHNCFLQVAAETGLVGLGAFLLFLSGLGKLAWAALKTPPQEALPENTSLWSIAAGIGAALFGFLIQSAFDTNLYALRQAVLFWTLSGILAGISSRLLHVRSFP